MGGTADRDTFDRAGIADLPSAGGDQAAFANNIAADYHHALNVPRTRKKRAQLR